MLDLRNKTSLLPVMEIIKNSKSFDGFIGLMAFVAISHRVLSNVYVTKTQNRSKGRIGKTEWNTYAKVVMI